MNRTRPLPVILAALVALPLAGCVPAGTLPSGTVPDEIPVPDCAIGTWHLDLEDYSAQALTYLADQGIPITALAYEGSYTISISAETTDGTPDLLFTASTGTTITAVVNGIPLTGTESYVGNAAFAWTDESHDAITLDGWTYLVEPDVDGELPGVAVLYPEESGEISLACSGDTMSLSGPGAPLVGLFVRE